MALQHKDTIYYDAETFKKPNSSAGSRAPTNHTPMVSKAATRYYDAQVLQFAEEPAPPPAQATRKKKGRKGGFLCCFRPSVKDQEDIVTRTDVELTSGAGEPPVQKRSSLLSLCKLTSIKEASLTKEQMHAQEGARGETANKDAVEHGQEVEIQATPQGETVKRKVSRTASIKRKLSNVLGRVSRRGSLGASGSGEFMSVGSMASVTPGALSEKDFEFYKWFSGWWVVDRPNSDDYSKLIVVMKLNFLLRKALDNSSHIFFDVHRDKLKNIARVFGLVDLREERSWSGDAVRVRRKDLRSGGAETVLIKTERGFILRNDWEDPLAGTSDEKFEKLDEETLKLTFDLERKTGESVHLVMYFHRDPTVKR